MDDFNFNIEGDMLYCNHVSKTEIPNVFQIEKVPVISKEVFQAIYKEWIEKEEKTDGKN